MRTIPALLALATLIAYPASAQQRPVRSVSEPQFNTILIQYRRAFDRLNSRGPYETEQQAAERQGAGGGPKVTRFLDSVSVQTYRVSVPVEMRYDADRERLTIQACARVGGDQDSNPFDAQVTVYGGPILSFEWPDICLHTARAVGTFPAARTRQPGVLGEYDVPPVVAESLDVVNRPSRATFVFQMTRDEFSRPAIRLQAATLEQRNGTRWSVLWSWTGTADEEWTVQMGND